MLEGRLYISKKQEGDFMSKPFIRRLCKAILCPYCRKGITWSNKNTFDGVVDAIVGVAFIIEKPQLPGESNLSIAHIIEDLHLSNRSLPLVVQKELQNLIRNIHCDFVLPGCDSLSVYGFFARLRKEHPKWKTIVCIAHADYLWLCALIAKEFGFALLVPVSVRSIPYNRHSSQAWTQSKWAFPRGAFWFTRFAGVKMALKGMI